MLGVHYQCRQAFGTLHITAKVSTTYFTMVPTTRAAPLSLLSLDNDSLQYSFTNVSSGLVDSFNRLLRNKVNKLRKGS